MSDYPTDEEHSHENPTGRFKSGQHPTTEGMMNDLTIEWVYPYFIKGKPEQHLNELDIARMKDVPVVRLNQVDALIGEMVWAMEQTLEWNVAKYGYKEHALRARTFLASPLVQAWRERQKEGT